MDKNILTKSDLDNMSENDIKSYRHDLIESYYSNVYAKDYLRELDVYLYIRFKDTVFSMYDRWLNGTSEDLISLSKILNRMGKEKFYHFTIERDIEEIGNLKYGLIEYKIN